MGRLARTLTINLVGRDDSLQKTYKRVNKGSALMSDNLRKAARVGGIGLTALGGAAIGAAAMIKPMIDMAADVQESVSKSRLVFGEASNAVEAFAETSLHSFGVTRREALEATGTFGSLGKAMGMAEADSAEMAMTLTGLAGDLSSLENVRVEEALTALRAGIIGEAEPLRRLGILLDAATIKQKAFEIGLIKSTKEALTPAMKSQAAYALILEKGAVAMGDFERTSDSAVNQTKILAGEFDHIQTMIGDLFLPMLTTIVTFLNDEVVPAVKDFAEDPSWIAAFQLLADGATSEFTKTAGTTLGNVTDWFINPTGRAIQAGYGMLFGYFTDAGDGAKKAYLEELLPDINESWAAKPNWDPEDWASGGTAAGTTFGAAALAAAVAAGAALFPPGGGMPGSGVTPPTVPDDAFPGMGPAEDDDDDGAPSGSRPPPGAGHPANPDSGSDGAFPGMGAIPPVNPQGVYTEFSPPSFTTGDELDAFYATLGITPPTPSQPPPGSGHTMDPGQRGAMSMTVVVNGVSGKEVVDAIGQYVDENGPLSSSLVA